MPPLSGMHRKTSYLSNTSVLKWLPFSFQTISCVPKQLKYWRPRFYGSLSLSPSSMYCISLTVDFTQLWCEWVQELSTASRKTEVFIPYWIGCTALSTIFVAQSVENSAHKNSTLSFYSSSFSCVSALQSEAMCLCFLRSETSACGAVSHQSVPDAVFLSH